MGWRQNGLGRHKETPRKHQDHQNSWGFWTRRVITKSAAWNTLENTHSEVAPSLPGRRRDQGKERCLLKLAQKFQQKKAMPKRDKHQRSKGLEENHEFFKRGRPNGWIFPWCRLKIGSRIQEEHPRNPVVENSQRTRKPIKGSKKTSTSSFCSQKTPRK